MKTLACFAHDILVITVGIPESDGERQDVEEGIDLEYTEEEDSEVFKCLSEEVPEQTNVGSQIRNCQSGGRV